ncbi:prolyl oligopeptidase family serine peptidase [Xanthomonas hyacinthi]|uniref:Peptidase S9 prolyl oligopeptidase catalytic domain-containing protein n=1 Tax=Xanthomonas hyacinthi TaxID=56455 RepID=A0A2S7EZZ8_9XANT|nr:prolyl oligopeptidase family serine peptidase [Xanthomonas hyacinthi]KLD79191.1 hypothetical protein Y886_05820 [Xanthomonas hyacinthi DSM 19077]PPU98676.1 hypothetical protein XhyaCFBP1156_04600 [Xanthomonas hyacinthi]QGY77494.1 prolyl oligopeptidase family serine peptidase [Xanthomonas hyacinthi]
MPRNGGLDRGFGYIAGLPKVRNGHFYMRQYTPDSGHSALYDIDADSATHRLIADIGRPDMAFVIDNQGTPRFATGVDPQDQPILLRADDNGHWSPMAEALRVRWRPFAFSRDGTRVFGYRADGGPASLVVSDANGADQTLLASDATYSVDDLQWTNRPAEPFAARLGPGRPRMQFFAGGPEAELYKALSAALPGRYVDFIDYSSDGDRVLLRLYSDRDAGGWYLFDRKETEYGRNYLQRVIGRDDADLVAHSPTALAGRITVPVLLVHGEEDQRAPFAPAKAMLAALEKSGNRPEWMAVPKEGHGFYNDDNNIAFYRQLETFLARHLGTAPASTASSGAAP